MGLYKELRKWLMHLWTFALCTIICFSTPPLCPERQSSAGKKEKKKRKLMYLLRDLHVWQSLGWISDRLMGTHIHTQQRNPREFICLFFIQQTRNAVIFQILFWGLRIHQWTKQAKTAQEAFISCVQRK